MCTHADLAVNGDYSKRKLKKFHPIINPGLGAGSNGRQRASGKHNQLYLLGVIT